MIFMAFTKCVAKHFAIYKDCFGFQTCRKFLIQLHGYTVSNCQLFSSKSGAQKSVFAYEYSENCTVAVANNLGVRRGLLLLLGVDKALVV